MPFTLLGQSQIHNGIKTWKSESSSIEVCLFYGGIFTNAGVTWPSFLDYGGHTDFKKLFGIITRTLWQLGCLFYLAWFGIKKKKVLFVFCFRTSLELHFSWRSWTESSFWTESFFLSAQVKDVLICASFVAASDSHFPASLYGYTRLPYSLDKS